MASFQVKTSDETNARLSAALDHYKDAHGLGTRGDVLDLLAPVIERACTADGGDPEATALVTRIKALTAALEVEAQSLATRVTTVRSTERAAVANDFKEAEATLADARAEVERLSRENGELASKNAELNERLDNAKAEFAKLHNENSHLKAQLDVVLGLTKQQPQQN